GMWEVLGRRPDLLSYGNVIGGGFPVAGYGGRRDLMELVAPAGPVYQAGTLSANPVGMRAGLATLQKIETENVYEKLEWKTARFCDDLNGDLKQRDLPFQLTQSLSIFWLHARHTTRIRELSKFPSI